ncbi:MAG: hypothetical protein J3T61_11305, partial [Candidatus Brocadiales bacterium]|nr:hypothetical protein [Candidatus Bathyanammoxibius sp.]
MDFEKQVLTLSVQTTVITKTTDIPFCCNQPIVGVRASGQDHYEDKQYYCRCNKCHTTGGLRPTLVKAIQAWKQR